MSSENPQNRPRFEGSAYALRSTLDMAVRSSSPPPGFRAVATEVRTARKLYPYTRRAE